MNRTSAQGGSEVTRALAILVMMMWAVACAETSEPAVDTGPGVSFGGNDTQVAVDTGMPPGGDTLLPDVPPTGCECPPKMHCNAEDGCDPDVCSKGQSTCATPTSLKICAVDGSSFEEEDCPDGQVCETGECVAPVCVANEKSGCDGVLLKKGASPKVMS